MRRPFRFAAVLAVVATFDLLAGSSAADVAVHGVIPGTQHSPSVALTPDHMYVLSYDRNGSTSTTDLVRLAGSSDGGATFQAVALPALPANWFWRPDAQVAYDPGTGQVWLAGHARSVLAELSEIGVYVATGTPLPNGSVAWLTPVPVWTQPGISIFVPGLALAVGDGTGFASVLRLDNYISTSPPIATLYRVSADLTSTTPTVLASGDPLDADYVAPSLAVTTPGDIVAGWVAVEAALPEGPAPIVSRRSQDGGVTYGAEELVGSIGFTENGPGATLRLLQPLTLLYARHSPDFPSTRVAFWSTAYWSGPQFDPSSIFLNSDCCGSGIWNPEPGTTIDRLPGSFEVLPAVTMAEDGYFYLGWHDFQPFDPDSVSQFMVARLWNMGFSASTPVALANATFDWDNIVSNFGGMGWSSAAGEQGGRVLFAWGDHRGADPDVYARAFRAGGFALTEGCGDTVEVTAGQAAQFAWRIENRNELFADEYTYGASGTRTWTNELEPDTVVIAPDGAADVSFSIAVPDTAADGLVQIFAYAQDHTRITNCPMFLRVTSLVAVGPGDGPGGRGVALAMPRPNPSAGVTAFTFSLPAPATVDLTLYDLRGRRIATLAQGALGAGEHAARWDGARAPAGVYFVRLTARTDAGVTTRERRLVILR